MYSYWPVIKFVVMVETVALELFVTGDHVCIETVHPDAGVACLLIVRFDVDIYLCASYYD